MSASAPAGSPSRKKGRLSADSRRDTRSGDGVSDVMSQPCATSAMYEPTYDAADAIQRALKTGCASGLHVDRRPSLIINVSLSHLKRRSPRLDPDSSHRLGSWSMRWIPGLSMLREYKAAWLTSDVMAGIVLTTMLVPVGIAYAEASGVPGIYGLYATIVPLLAYAVFGPSRILVLGPDSSLVPV